MSVQRVEWCDFHQQVKPHPTREDDLTPPVLDCVMLQTTTVYIVPEDEVTVRGQSFREGKHAVVKETGTFVIPNPEDDG